MTFFTDRQFWLLVHLALGALYLHGFGMGVLGLAQPHRRARLAALGAILLAGAAVASVVTGTWLVYPWYRAPVPDGGLLAASPKAWLLAQPSLAWWHTFGMEWKEHVAWLSPMCAVAVAFVLGRYGRGLLAIKETHSLLRLFLGVAFASGLVAGILGGLLNKVAPNTFLLY
jgi:hypothetical protein